MFHPHPRILKILIPPKRVSTRNILHLIFAWNFLSKSVELCAQPAFRTLPKGGLVEDLTKLWLSEDRHMTATFVSSFSNSLCSCFAVILPSFFFNVDEFHITLSENSTAGFSLLAREGFCLKQTTFEFAPLKSYAALSVVSCEFLWNFWKCWCFSTSG